MKAHGPSKRCELRAHHRASHLRRLDCDVTYVLYEYEGCPIHRTVSYIYIYINGTLCDY